MFERFTDRARRTIVFAQEEARLLNHQRIGTGHFLLGLIHEGESGAWVALRESGVTLDNARSQVIRIMGQGVSAPPGHIPFAPQAKKILEMTLRKSLEIGHDFMAPEHVLLGLIDFIRRSAQNGDGLPMAALVLDKLGVDLDILERRTLELVNERHKPLTTESLYDGEARVDPTTTRQERVELLYWYFLNVLVEDSQDGTDFDLHILRFLEELKSKYGSGQQSA